MVLTASPGWKPSTPGPTDSIVPAASYPNRAGKTGSSRYCPRRNIDSARFRPKALTAIRTSPLLGGGTSTVSILRTSGPPNWWKRTARAMTISFKKASRRLPRLARIIECADSWCGFQRGLLFL